MWKERITVDPAIQSGKPCIRGMRIPVSVVLSLRSVGETKESILDHYPDLESEDIDASLAYAAWRIGGHETHFPSMLV